MSSKKDREKEKERKKDVVDVRIVGDSIIALKLVVGHNFKGPDPIFFFYFFACFSGPIRWNRFTILFFFSSLACKHEK